jgi:hypothetical protein
MKQRSAASRISARRSACSRVLAWRIGFRDAVKTNERSLLFPYDDCRQQWRGTENRDSCDFFATLVEK